MPVFGTSRRHRRMRRLASLGVAFGAVAAYRKAKLTASERRQADALGLAPAAPSPPG